MWKLLFLAISLAGVFCAEDQHYQTTSKAPPVQQPSASQYPQQAPQAGAKPGVKDVTAGGRYYDGGEHGHDHHGYNHGHRIFRGFDVPLIDDYICDLDATILVVTNTDTPNTLFQAQVQDSPQGAPAPDAGAPADSSYNRAKRSAYIPPEYGQGRENYGPAKEYAPPREYYGGRDKYDREHDGYPREFGHKYDHDFDTPYHGHGSGVVANADRLRCSVIAGNDEDSCTACCRLSARRDRSISKEKIIGFLVDNNQLNYDAQAHGGEGYGDNYGDRKKRSDAPVYGQGQVASAPVEIPTLEADNRCVCCAPKRYRPFIFDRFFRRQHPRYHHDGYAGPY